MHGVGPSSHGQGSRMLPAATSAERTEDISSTSAVPSVERAEKRLLLAAEERPSGWSWATCRRNCAKLFLSRSWWSHHHPPTTQTTQRGLRIRSTKNGNLLLTRECDGNRDDGRKSGGVSRRVQPPRSDSRCHSLQSSAAYSLQASRLMFSCSSCSLAWVPAWVMGNWGRLAVTCSAPAEAAGRSSRRAQAAKPGCSLEVPTLGNAPGPAPLRVCWSPSLWSTIDGASRDTRGDSTHGYPHRLWPK